MCMTGIGSTSQIPHNGGVSASEKQTSGTTISKKLVAVSSQAPQYRRPAPVRKEPSPLSPNPRKNLAPPSQPLWDPDALPSSEQPARRQNPQHPRRAGKSSNPGPSQATSHARQRSEFQQPLDWQSSLRSQTGEKKSSMPLKTAFLKKGDGFKNRTARVVENHENRMKAIKSVKEKEHRAKTMEAKRVKTLRAAILKNPNPKLTAIREAMKARISSPEFDPGLPRLMPFTRYSRAFFIPLDTPMERLKKELHLPEKAQVAQIAQVAQPLSGETMPGLKAPHETDRVETRREAVSDALANKLPYSADDSDTGFLPADGGLTLDSTIIPFTLHTRWPVFHPPSPSGDEGISSTSAKSPKADGGSDGGAVSSGPVTPVKHMKTRSQRDGGRLRRMSSQSRPNSDAESAPKAAPLATKPNAIFKRPAQAKPAAASLASKPATAANKPTAASKPAVRWVISDGRWQKASDVVNQITRQGQAAKTIANRPVANVPKKPEFEDVRPNRVRRLIDFWENNGIVITPLKAPVK